MESVGSDRENIRAHGASGEVYAALAKCLDGATEWSLHPLTWKIERELNVAG
jgi:hypothetical protein